MRLTISAALLAVLAASPDGLAHHPGEDLDRVMGSKEKFFQAIVGLDAHNWMFLTKQPESPEDATRKLAETYNVRFKPVDGDQQMHGVVTHVIDREGRFAAKFHGLRFDSLNLVLYIHGLTNRHYHSEKPRETGRKQAPFR